MDTDWTDAAESITGYKFNDPALLEQALSHSSAVDNRTHSNERLEFLGDAVLGFVVCSETYARFPQFEEGDMTKVKSTVVSRKICAESGVATSRGQQNRSFQELDATSTPLLHPASVAANPFTREPTRARRAATHPVECGSVG